MNYEGCNMEYPPPINISLDTLEFLWPVDEAEQEEILSIIEEELSEGVNI